MRVTIEHSKTPEEVKASVDRGFDQIFAGFAAGPVQFDGQQRAWRENSLLFSMIVRMGFVRAPIRGTILVEEKLVTVDVDLGVLEKLVSQESVRRQIEGRVRRLMQ